MPLPPIDQTYLLDFLSGLLNTPSPTGYTEAGIRFTEKALAQFPELELNLNRKGGLLVTVPGQKSDRIRGLAAHVDTLGAMVKEIKPNGRLKLTQLGWYAWNTIEGEGCTIFAANGEQYRGSILIHQTAIHVYGQETADTKREESSIEVRVDARTSGEEDTRALGIEVGDFVALDPRVEIVNGFVRSRHLDDKACVACIAAALKALHDAGLKPVQTTQALITNYEEVGHGASSGFPQDVTELVAVDMAAIGDGQTSDEFYTTICVKDSGGPYHHGLSQHLRKLAKDNGIDFKVDIYPHYGSDGGALLRAGADIAVALIGPGVDASHSYERTHIDALIDTTRLILAYLLN